MIGALRALDEELHERLVRVTTRRNEYGYDPFGADPLALRALLLPVALTYRHWLRVETHGIERVPEGRVLLIANHAGNTFAWDGAMLGMAMMLEAELRGAGKRARFEIYPGVDHAFFNDTRPDVYDAKAAARAFAETLAFLRAELA